MSDAKELVRRQYGSVGDAYVRSAGFANAKDLPRMVELANPNGSESLLDIATGGGHVVHVFSPDVREVIASDLTPEILEHAATAFEEWGLTNVSTAEADAEFLPFDDERFDIVTCRIAPHHFPNPGAFVHEVARVLKPGGTFLLVDSTVPEGEDGEFYNRFEEVRDHSHVRSLTTEEWGSLIQAAGLELHHTEDFRKRHDFADWVKRSRTSAANQRALNEMMVTASKDRQSVFEVEIESDEVIAFTDTKTLFHATK